MFCFNCGAENTADVIYCFKCGNELWPANPPRRALPARSIPSKTEPSSSIKQLDAIFQIDHKPHECHSCGRKDNLLTFEFGLGKKVSSRRLWKETAVSAGISAVTMPFLGMGVIHLPGKRTRFQVLRLQLVLCKSCLTRCMTSRPPHHVDLWAYALHPWWIPAKCLGYTEVLAPDQLKNMNI